MLSKKIGTIVGWRTIEELEREGIGLPRDESLALTSRRRLEGVALTSSESGGQGQQRDRSMPLGWRTIGLPARRGIGLARENIDGACEPSVPLVSESESTVDRRGRQ